MNLFGRNKKSKNVQKLDEDSNWNKDLKRNIVNKTGTTQEGFEFSKKHHSDATEDTSGPKNVLRLNIEKLTQDHIKILKNCAHENTAAELIKILKRTNKSRFKATILKPLVNYGFFELTIKPIIKNGKKKWSTSPNLKYRLTGKFVSKKVNS